MMNRLEVRSDAELLELSLTGDESAFLLLYERLKGPIFRYAFYMTNSKAAAEEVTQEVFISLLKNGDRYKPAKGDVPGFVFGIARNFVRRLKKREHVYQGLPCNDDHYRQVIVLCDLCELTYVEVAARLECAVGTVRSRLNRAHALLAQKLKQSRKRQPELPATGTEECLI